MPEPWPTLLAFVLCLSLLTLVQRWITQHMQGIGMLLFGSVDAGMAVLWTVLLPGIIVHELSHWLIAKLVGLRTGRFRVWPQLKAQQIILGSVEIQKTNPVLDSLVGLAPFLGGTLALLAIGNWAFDAGTLGLAFEEGQWRRLLELLAGMLQVPDAWIWLYLLVAISNAMMPSPTDTASWRSVLLYLGLIAVVLLILGWWPALPATWIEHGIFGLEALTYALGLTLAVDLVFALVIGLVELAISAMRGSRVLYK